MKFIRMAAWKANIGTRTWRWFAYPGGRVAKVEEECRHDSCVNLALVGAMGVREQAVVGELPI